MSVAVLWPSILCTTLTFAPAEIVNEAQVCRNSCGTKSPSFTAAAALSNFHRNSPSGSHPPRGARPEIVLAAADLVAWAQLINDFRYRVRHVAARITRGARRLRLRIDATWRWAGAIATARQRIRAAFP
ncbi:MAG: hypothetical protein QG597_4690 [Actinomycetota bacterium]|nr:hypothetical protein [Actinomycetota bacterium]